MKFIFPGKPISRKAHKHGSRGGKNYSYDSQSKEMNDHKILLKSMILQLCGQEKQELTEMAIAEAFDVTLTFYLKFPSKFNKRKINAIVEGFEPNIANVYPDLDNCMKFYLDVAKEILYKDDKEIISCSLYKYYDLDPKTIFRITPVGVSWTTKSKTQ